MPETTALGAAMAAGAAEGVSVWSLDPNDLTEVTSEKFEPQINPEGTSERLQLIATDTGHNTSLNEPTVVSKQYMF